MEHLVMGTLLLDDVTLLQGTFTLEVGFTQTDEHTLEITSLYAFESSTDISFLLTDVDVIKTLEELIYAQEM